MMLPLCASPLLLSRAGRGVLRPRFSRHHVPRRSYKLAPFRKLQRWRLLLHLPCIPPRLVWLQATGRTVVHFRLYGRPQDRQAAIQREGLQLRLEVVGPALPPVVLLLQLGAAEDGL